MSDAKHTPGPWHLNGTSAWADSCKDRGSIFTCQLRTGTHIPADQNEANARLIAASPDLLAACKTALYWAEHPNGTAYPERDQGLQNVRAAIAKAVPQ